MKLNRKTLFAGLLAAGVAALGLSACGGGGSSAVTPASSSSLPPLLSVGNISGFGSVIINGVRFDTTSATVAFDDAEDPVGTANSGMQIGMNAEVKGSVNDDKVSGSASDIYIESMVRGPVASVTPDATGNGGTLVAMGQKIVADSATNFYNITKVGDLKAGDVVNVHGLLNTDGSIQAKFVEKRDPAMVKYYKTYGTTAKTDTTKMTFMVGTLNVTYDSTTKLKNLPNGLSDGLLVRVSGLATDYNATTNTLKAAKVKQVDPFGEHGMNEGEIKGAVSNLDTTKMTFTVGNTNVAYTSTTTFKNGTATDLANGAMVEVEGAIANSVLTARSIEFRKPEMEIDELHGVIADLAATTTPAGFSFTVKGQKVQTDGNTVFTLKSSTALQNGMKVEVDGSSVTNGVLLATRVREEM
ncbi:MAG: hypothetical protein KGJ44_06460 [Betaproteobacteria bacterium]|nr:hypothetical protein [Betaproteobacteria bacterium]